MDDKIRKLEERQAVAREAAKKATADLAKAKRKAKAKARKEAEAAEQAAALAFYREHRELIAWMQKDRVWRLHPDDEEVVTRYEFCCEQMAKEKARAGKG